MLISFTILPSMHYWLTIVRLFEPLQVLDTGEQEGLTASPTNCEESPREIVFRAKICLQTLIRLYYACHGSDEYDLFIVLLAVFIGFGALADAVANDTSRDVSESTVVLCAYMLHGQSHIAYLGEIVFRVMLRSLPTHVAANLSRSLNINEVDKRRNQQATQLIQSEWPIRVARIMEETDDPRLGNLFRAINEIDVHDSVSTNDGSDHGTPPSF
jgi:hypothetical protein